MFYANQEVMPASATKPGGRDAQGKWGSSNRSWSDDELKTAHADLLKDKVLLKELAARKIDQDTVVAFGLGKFSSRIVLLPIQDQSGGLINVRYYNTVTHKKWGIAERPVKVLYPFEGLDPTKPILICEGEFDALAGRAAGFNTITTISGAPSAHLVIQTYLNWFDANTKARFVLGYDNDTAGIEATIRVSKVLKDRVIGMIRWPDECKDGYDLTDWLIERGPEEFRTLTGAIDVGALAASIGNASPIFAAAQVAQVTQEDSADDDGIDDEKSLSLPDDKFNMETCWPTSGFLHDYVKYAGELTDAPEQFHCAVAMNVLGVATLRRTYYVMGADRIYPNFYTCIVAPSSYFRKTTSVKIGLRVLNEIDEELTLPREFSTESMIAHLVDRPMGVLVYSEIAELLNQFKRSYSEGLLSLLTDFYDCPVKYSRKTLRDGEKTVQFPFISILAATTMDWLNENLTRSQAEGGFWPRFVFFTARKKTKNIKLPDPADPTMFKIMAQNVLDVTNACQGRCSLSSGAKELLMDWVDKHNQPGKSAILGNSYLRYVARMQPICLKIAILFSISEHKSRVIPQDAMARACNLCDWLLMNLEYMFAFEFAWGKKDALDNLVLAYIREKGSDGVTLRDLSRRFRLRGKELSDCINTLSLREYAEVAPGKRVVAI